MPNSPFLESIHRYMSVRRYGKRTIEAYLFWIKWITIKSLCFPLLQPFINGRLPTFSTARRKPGSIIALKINIHEDTP